MRDAKLWRAMRKTCGPLVGRPFAQPSDPPRSFDCVSLLKHVYEAVGFEIPWDELARELGDVFSVPHDWWRSDPGKDYYSRGAAIVGFPVDRLKVYPGDLLLFSDDGAGVPTHAGVALDASQFVHATIEEGVACPKLHDRHLRVFRAARRIKNEYRGTHRWD